MSSLLLPSRLIQAALAVAFLAAPTASVWAQGACPAITDAEAYTFQNRNSTLFIQASTTDATVTQEAEQEGLAAQAFALEDAGGGAFRIKSRATGLYVEAVSAEPNTPIRQAALDPQSEAQRFRILDGSDRLEGYCRIQSLAFDRYIRSRTKDAGDEIVTNEVNPQFTSYLFLVEPAMSVAGEARPEGSALLSLRGVTPNPAVDFGAVRFGLGTAAEVGVEVFDVLGRRVAVATPQPFAAGEGLSRSLDLGGLSSGVYLVRVRAQAGGAVEAQTVLATVAR